MWTQRLINVLRSYDVALLATITAGNCKQNETISSAAWSLEQDGKIIGRILRPLIDALFFFDPSHCAVSFLNENRVQND